MCYYSKYFMPLSNALIPITNVFTGGELFDHLLLNSCTKQSTHSKDVCVSLELTFKCESSCSDISLCALKDHQYPSQNSAVTLGVGRKTKCSEGKSSTLQE